MIRKFKIKQLFLMCLPVDAVSLPAMEMTAALVRLGGICPALGRVTADDALMSGVGPVLLSDSSHRCVLIFI